MSTSPESVPEYVVIASRNRMGAWTVRVEVHQYGRQHSRVAPNANTLSDAAALGVVADALRWAELDATERDL